MSKFHEKGKYPIPGIRAPHYAKKVGQLHQGRQDYPEPELIRFQVYCIDYVIIHELCHLVHPNHSKDFYQLKEKYLPDWAERKGRLERS